MHSGTAFLFCYHNLFLIFFCNSSELYIIILKMSSTLPCHGHINHRLATPRYRQTDNE